MINPYKLGLPLSILLVDFTEYLLEPYEVSQIISELTQSSIEME